MSIDKWSIVDMADVNRITDMNIYTILECEEWFLDEESAKADEESAKADEESAKAEEESAKAEEGFCHLEMVDIDYKSRENEKKIDVYKIMKEYVKKHRKKYSSF